MGNEYRCDICGKTFIKENHDQVYSVMFFLGNTLEIESTLCDDCMNKIISVYPNRSQEVLNTVLKRGEEN